MKEFELEPGERVIRETRKHWLYFAIELLPYGVFALFPFAIPPVLTLLPSIAPYAARIDFSTALMRAAFGIWLLVVWTGAWGSFTRYYLNAWVLTNQRIVDIKQRSFFSRQVSSVLLSRVQDVTTDVTGVLPSFLNIGTINVQSAGATNEFHMDGLPDPEIMRDLILKYVPEASQKGAL